MSDDPDRTLRELFVAIDKDAEQYFKDATKAMPEKSSHLWGTSETGYFWKNLTPELRDKAYELTDRLVRAGGALAEFTRSSPLSGSEDVNEVKLAIKTARAALLLREYHFDGPRAIHDEGTVLGFTPAHQSENGGLSPVAASKQFDRELLTLDKVLRFTEASTTLIETRNDVANSASEPARYRTGTAFIMMWMDPKVPELEDVADTVRSVFSLFEVRALRADDIEHEGLITERVLNEIRTSEFLFADLTGARPNVYYEIGYAHALGKRVILFRKAGTGLHFDLAGYNCPEYENLRDLRDKLTRRLVDLTNRNPSMHSKT